MTAAVDGLAGLDLDGVDDAALGALIAGLHRQAQRVEAVRLACVAAGDRRMVWKAEGARSAHRSGASSAAGGRGRRAPPTSRPAEEPP